jgi:hypothetical protein
MNRRGFLGALGALAAAPVVGAAVEDKPQAIPVKRADGTSYILGVAMQDVHVGDLVQIQTSGAFR